MIGTDAIEIKFQRGKGSKATVTAAINNSVIFRHKFDLADADKRSEFVDKLCKAKADIDRETVARQLEQLAGESIDDEGDGDKLTQAHAMVKLVDGAELFNDGETAYLTVEISCHRETHAIKSTRLRDFLRGRYWTVYGKAAGSQATQDAIETLCGRAMNEGTKRPVAVRVAEHDGAIYLDLCNDKWQAVKVTAGGWEIVNHPPVKFIRKKAMKPLPLPVRGGSIDELGPLVNARDEDSWILMVAWLIGVFAPNGPYAVLAVNGEQGSAKTTTCKMLRRLVDPNEADLRSAPKDDRDLIIAANNSRIVAFDNLSTVSPVLSDGLCRLATGGGFSTRALYSNDEETIFNITRPILFNGIEELATRPDLLERAVVLNLPTIPDEQRCTEAELSAKYDEARPRILGALLDAVAIGLGERPNVKLPRRPRMADFAEFVVAAEAGLPWAMGGFLAAYERNRGEANELAIETSAIGPAIQTLIATDCPWLGTASDLLNALNRDADDRTRQRQDWPKTPRSLSGALRRIAPALRRLGIDASFDKQGKDRRRIIRLETIQVTSSAPSAASANANFSDAGPELADGATAGKPADRPPKADVAPANSGEADAADGADGELPSDSNSAAA